MLEFSIYTYIILNPYYVGSQGSHDIKLQVTMAAMFNVRDALSVCYNSNFSLSEDEFNCDEGEEVPCLPRAKCYTPEEVAALSIAVTSEPKASCSSSTSADRLICQY